MSAPQRTIHRMVRSRSIFGFFVLAALASGDYLLHRDLVERPAMASSSKAAPLFVYEEGGDRVSFFSPRTVRIVHAARGDAGVHSCQYELSDNDNMYSGADIENAFLGSVVQTELHARHSYASPHPGTLAAGSDRVEWMSSCAHGCTNEPPTMQQFQSMLRTLMLNARLVCP